MGTGEIPNRKKVNGEVLFEVYKRPGIFIIYRFHLKLL
jgi:hypothetical protein